MPERRWRRTAEGQVVRVEPTAPRPRRKRPDAGGGTPEAPSPARRASLLLGLRLGFRDVYDYAGMVLVMSLAYCGLGGLGLLGGQALGVFLFLPLPPQARTLFSQVLAVAGAVLVAGPFTAGMFYYARNAAARREPELFDLRWGFTEAFLPSLRLAGLQAGVIAILLANIVYYLSSGQPLLGIAASVFGYLLAFWGLMGLYQWALLVEQGGQVRRLVYRSGLLVLDNFGFSLGLGGLVLLLSLLAWFTVIGGVLAWPGALALILTQATRELLRKYSLLPPDPTLDPVAEEAER